MWSSDLTIHSRGDKLSNHLCNKDQISFMACNQNFTIWLFSWK